MNLLHLLDRVMRTSPRVNALPQEAPSVEDLTKARKDISELQQDLEEMDAAVSVAETKLRARGLRFPTHKRKSA